MLNKTGLVTVLFVIISFLFLYKLDYLYFFTDEILYIDSGREHLKGIYDSAMQVPLLTKYIAGIMYQLADHNVFLLRLPFAIMGIISAVLVYKIIKREFGYWWGLLGTMLFASSSIVYSSTRMVMLEALMHLSWLSFLYFFYSAIKHNHYKWFLYSGVTLGFAFASKVTSVILIPFTLVFFLYHTKTNKLDFKKSVLRYLIMYTIGFGVFLSTYVHTFLKVGGKSTIKLVYNSLINVYFSKSVAGKNHIINNKTYTRSPSWTYLYYLYVKEGILRLFTYFVGVISALINKSLFVYYWSMFFLISLIFHQLSGVKNARYISSFEIPIIILTIAGFYYLSQKLKLIRICFFTVVILLFVYHSVIAVTQNRTEYNALFENYLKIETNNYTSNDKIYLYGSTRSSRWYKHGKGVGKKMFEISKNLDAHCLEFQQYDYIIIEKDELARYGNNLLYEYVTVNHYSFHLIEKYGFLIFKKIHTDPSHNVCK